MILWRGNKGMRTSTTLAEAIAHQDPVVPFHFLVFPVLRDVILHPDIKLALFGRQFGLKLLKSSKPSNRIAMLRCTLNFFSTGLGNVLLPN